MQAKLKHVAVTLFILLLFSALTFQPARAGDVFTEADLLNLKYVTSAKISPDGKWIAYTVRTPRDAGDEPGSAYVELYVVSVATGEIKPFVTGEESVAGIAWKPDGTAIGFVAKRGDNTKKQVWMIPVDGGEARQLTDSPTSILEFKWHPSEDEIAYVAETPKTKREETLDKMGYDFVFYEEDQKHRNLYLLDLDRENAEARQLTNGVTVRELTFSPDGKTIAATVTEENLIDYNYVFKHVHLLDIESGEMNKLTDNPGKLGNFVFSPNGKHLAYAGAASQSDHAASQVYVMPVTGGEATNLTLKDFRGHINWVGWKDNNTVVYRANEGVTTTLSTVPMTGNGVSRNVILDSKDTGFVFDPPSYTDDFKHFALVGESADNPGNLFYWNGKKMKRLTTVNPWLAQRDLGKQEAIQYTSRDGAEIEGLLIYPVDYDEGTKHPLVVIVHGGPESNYSDGWLTRYSTPGQNLAGRGYFAFYPNYRSSTGYGVDYAAVGYNDPAGKEFDDIADGIKHLIDIGYVDADRVGLGGGSYGGYASGWFATYYTDLVKAVCMFVGISDLISKRGTSDIPYEMLYVHLGERLEEMWELSLKRSPIYWAHKSKTATLIYGGLADTRVDPGQSRELYRRMKMNNHPAVRLVQYPGEGHGNRKQPGRIDVLYRVLDWYDWYVKDGKPIDGPMPPLDISHKYGLDLPEPEMQEVEGTH